MSSSSLSPAQAEQVIAALENSGEFRVMRRMPGLPLGRLESRPGLVKVVILDTESTGLTPGQDKLIEVAMLAVMVDAQTGEFVGDAQASSWLEDPGFALEDHTVALTGLTDADLKGHHFDEVEIGRFMDGAGLVIAHSAAHDRPFFEARFPRLNDFAWGCTLRQVDWASAGAGSSKLEFLLFTLGLFYKAHRALPDCHALGHVLRDFHLPSGQSVMQHMIAASLEDDCHVFANGAPFDSKDVLKASGYYWDGDGKVWHRTVPQAVLADELDWLYREVYCRPARVRVDVLTAHARYSSNPPASSVSTSMRSVGPQGDRPVSVAASSSTGRAGRYGHP